MSVSDEAAIGLVESLERGSDELAALLRLTEREQEALVAAKHDAFAARAEEKQDALTKFMRRQDEIIAALHRAGGQLGLAAGEITLSAIRERVPSPSRERLATLASEVKGRLDSLREANTRSADLLGRALGYYDFLARLIIEAFTDHPEYGPRAAGDGPRPIMMDERA